MTPSTPSPISAVMRFLDVMIHKQAQLPMPRIYLYIEAFFELAKCLFLEADPSPN